MKMQRTSSQYTQTTGIIMPQPRILYVVGISTRKPKFGKTENIPNYSLVQNKP